jgi:hypothetical protein
MNATVVSILGSYLSVLMLCAGGPACWRLARHPLVGLASVLLVGIALVYAPELAGWVQR